MREIVSLDQYRKTRDVQLNNHSRLNLDSLAGVQNVKPVEKHYFYDIRDIGNGKSNVSTIAKVFLEEGTGLSLRDRITTSDLYSENKIERSDWRYNIYSEAEKQATINVFGLGKAGYNLVFWISPPDDKETSETVVYKEGRLNIEFPVFNKDGGWSVYGKHMPLFLDSKESVVLAKKLLECGGVSLKEIDSVEDVRQQPVGFKIDNTEEWIEKCRELIPEFEEVWNFIQKGGDVENQERMKKDVMEALEKANGDNYVFEWLMKEMGNKINQEGGHGSAWGGGEMGIVVSVDENGMLVYRVGSTEGLKYCPKCDCYYTGEACPRCSKKTSLSLAA